MSNDAKQLALFAPTGNPIRGPTLTDYDVILINSSAGKDSQAMLDVVCHLAKAQGVADRVVVVHCDLGKVEWKGTRELAEEQAEHYGARFEVVSRRQGDLLAHIEQRGMFPSNKARYCTSDHKRAPVCRLMTSLTKELALNRPARILNCMGLRADESPARAKRLSFVESDPVYSNATKRHVDTWLPIFAWTVDEVWSRIRTAGTRHHYAYDLGMGRVSCVFCIFAPRNALLLAGEHNPILLSESVGVEQSTGHTLRQDQSLAEIQTALGNGEHGNPRDRTWMQCA